ncbi:hypothetical protein FB451DRAFT_1493222 [Mycena latifolia]|nr:hypothetical protein FB451DRAFT_1493222 [Mycena latifolia]
MASRTKPSAARNNRDKAPPQTRTRATRSSGPVLQDNNLNLPPTKRQKTSITGSTGIFLNPFTISAPESEADSDKLPPNVYMQVPLENATFGYTPEYTVAEMEARGPITPKPVPVPNNLETPPSPSSFGETPIDPTLDAIDDNTKANSSKSAWFETPSIPIERQAPNSIASSSKSAWFSTASTPIVRPVPLKKLVPNPFLNNFPKKEEPRSPRSRSMTPVVLGSPNPPIQAAVLPHPTPILPNKNRTHAMSIPKVITERLTDQEVRIMDLERQVSQDTDTLVSLREAQAALRAEYDDLDNEHHLTLKRLEKIEGEMEKQTETIHMLFDAIQRGGGTLDDGDSKTKGRRDNALNTAIRKTFFTAMGLPNKPKLKDAALIRSKESGGGYIKDRETSGRLLRPDWTVSFVENSSWHLDIINYMRQKVPVQQPAITADIMKAKSDDEILDRVEVVFKNIVTEARKLAKQPDAEGEVNPPTSIVLDDAAQKQDNCRKGRKLRKCEERQNALAKAKIELPQGFNFFLQPQYQSTDESDVSDVLDPDTDTEDSKEVPAPSTRKPWISRTPYYRHDKFQNIVLKTEELVQKQRDEFQKNNKGKTPAHPRIRGEWKETRLPFISSGGKKPKIPRFAIHPEWLADHPDDDTPSRIQDEEKPGEATAAEDEAMSGD